MIAIGADGNGNKESAMNLSAAGVQVDELPPRVERLMEDVPDECDRVRRI